MHVQPQWVNKLLFPSFVKDKWGEPLMTPCLVTLVKRVAELRESGLKPCHCIKNSPFGEFALLAVERSWLSNARG
jgi:hypothetical protein